MKKFALAICLLFASTICAHAKTPPNPASYPITIHVTGSHLVPQNGEDREHLDVVIDGQRYELRSTDPGKTWVFRLGDYKARLTASQSTPYDFFYMYELLLPDNSTRQFQVIGIPDPTLLPTAH